MLVALSSLSSQQTKGTEHTAEDAVKFLNCCATHPESIIQFKKSDMILQCHSDASYLSESQARSRAGVSTTWEQQTSATQQSTVQY
jgi:hypothetical protein